MLRLPLKMACCELCARHSLLWKTISASWSWLLFVMGCGESGLSYPLTGTSCPWHVGWWAGHGRVPEKLGPALIMLVVSWALCGYGDLDKSWAVWRSHETAQIPLNYKLRPGSVHFQFSLPLPSSLFSRACQRGCVCQQITVPASDLCWWAWGNGKTRC